MTKQGPCEEVTSELTAKGRKEGPQRCREAGSQQREHKCECPYLQTNVTGFSAGRTEQTTQQTAERERPRVWGLAGGATESALPSLSSGKPLESFK